MITLTSNPFKSIHPRKKQPFLLFEVLIAILLVSICLVPLIERPIRSYISEWKLIKEIEGERLANIAFSEIKEKLLKNEIPWAKIPGPGQMTKPFLLPPVTLTLGHNKPISIERSFVLKCKKKGEKTNQENECYRLLNIEIFFHPRLSQKKINKNKGHYTYHTLVSSPRIDKNQ